MANCKVAARKGCNVRWDATIGWIGVVSHHLRSLLGGITLTVFVHVYAE